MIDFCRLNRNVKISKHNCQLTSRNSISIIRQYDVVLDATDNVATRYLLNDSCIFARKPLVSGSALQTEGQLTVYNHLSSPCYRCLYPQPPPANAVNNCSSSGVLGPSTQVLFDHFLRRSSIAWMHSYYFSKIQREKLNSSWNILMDIVDKFSRRLINIVDRFYWRLNFSQPIFKSRKTDSKILFISIEFTLIY